MTRWLFSRNVGESAVFKYFQFFDLASLNFFLIYKNVFSANVSFHKFKLLVLGCAQWRFKVVGILSSAVCVMKLNV